VIPTRSRARLSTDQGNLSRKQLVKEPKPFGSLRETHGKVDLAMAWFEEEGLTTISDLFELDEEGQNSFVAALKLKFKEKQLLKSQGCLDGDAKPPSAM
jgi:hypothetical protein